jgi:ubiquinone/menaquinone biosynthesis C-methylase UbiE
LGKKVTEVQKFYDQETSRYISDRYSGESCEQMSYLIRKKIVLDFLCRTRGKILDVGCGPAIFTNELSDMGLKPYSADVSFEMLKNARSITAENTQTYWLNCEIERLPFPSKSFDNVISIGVIAYVNETKRAIGELYRVLKPGGILVIQCSNSLAPTPLLHSVKDEILFSFGLRKRRWSFKLDRYPMGKFLHLLKSCGFKITGDCRYDFRLPFIEKFCPNAAKYLMKKLQTALQNSRLFGWAGEGYVVRAIKP